MGLILVSSIKYISFFCQDPLGLLEGREHEVNRDHKAHLDNLDLPDRLDPLVNLDLEEKLDLLDNEEHLVCLDLQDPPVSVDNPEKLDHKELREHEDNQVSDFL